MRNHRFSFLFAVLGVISLACLSSSVLKVTPTAEIAQSTTAPELTQAVQSSQLGIIQSVTMAKDVQSQDHTPVGPTVNFVNPTIIHVVVALADAPANTKLAINWLVGKAGNLTPDSQMATYELTTDGTRNIDFTFTPDQPMDAGRYYFNIFLNGQFFIRVDFSVATQ